MSDKSKQRTSIYISYSHRDKQWVDRLLLHLRYLQKTGKIDVWSDANIQAGSDWKEEIEKSIKEARIAILLISPDFLASEFITKKELPTILNSAKRQGTLIMPIMIRHTFIEAFPELMNYQFINPPNKPLSSLSASEQDEVFVEISRHIDDMLHVTKTKVTSRKPKEPNQLVAEIAQEVIKLMDSNEKKPGELQKVKAKKEIESNLVFVIMSFDTEMEPIYEGISEAAKAVNLEAKRVKDVIGDYRITNKILQMIAQARIIVTDLSLERPNVYFELGYARGLSKNVITIARKGAKVHFDVKDWTYLEYFDSRMLEKDMKERFEFELEKGA